MVIRVWYIELATESLGSYKEKHQNEKFVFAAFNALNKAEEKIIQAIIDDDLASIYWDHDNFYTKSNNQSEQFFKKYLTILALLYIQ